MTYPLSLGPLVTSVKTNKLKASLQQPTCCIKILQNGIASNDLTSRPQSSNHVRVKDLVTLGSRNRISIPFVTKMVFKVGGYHLDLGTRWLWEAFEPPHAYGPGSDSYNCPRHCVLAEAVCVNITYLPKEYGLSFVMTLNEYTIYNETISARMKRILVAKYELGCFTIPLVTAEGENELSDVRNGLDLVKATFEENKLLNVWNGLNLDKVTVKEENKFANVWNELDAIKTSVEGKNVFDVGNGLESLKATDEEENLLANVEESVSATVAGVVVVALVLFSTAVPFERVPRVKLRRLLKNAIPSSADSFTASSRASSFIVSVVPSSSDVSVLRKDGRGHNFLRANLNFPSPAIQSCEPNVVDCLTTGLRKRGNGTTTPQCTWLRFKP
uniref:Uncharacterized protein n=1 Tax=Timema tahoe TaxID=61484 RepID=A0A7R9NX79_9NEOP|nr:unnamed protein product [Timema tahoe]